MMRWDFLPPELVRGMTAAAYGFAAVCWAMAFSVAVMTIKMVLF